MPARTSKPNKSSSPKRQLQLRTANASSDVGTAGDDAEILAGERVLIDIAGDSEDSKKPPFTGTSPDKKKERAEAANGLSEDYETREKRDKDDISGTRDDAEHQDNEMFDPALFDEEEVPDEHTSSKPATAQTFGGGYNALKSFGGQVYSGMAIGGSHTWNYQPGVWKETKKEPDLWEIDYKTNKVRNHKAPINSGAPVGTQYHWYIIAHQMVEKIDANTYETHLTGHKYKLTHKNVNQKNWEISSVKGQRERELFLLDDAKRRVEGLPPVLSNEKVKVDKKEKGQATLGSFFGPGISTPSPKKRKAEASINGGSPNGSAKKAKADTS